MKVTAGALELELEPGERVAVVGHDRARWSAAGAGYVPAGRHIFPSLSVEENLRVGAYRDKAHFAERRDEFAPWFPDLAQRAATLSGGEQQLLVIARALMAGPQLLIIEDPSAGLGPPAIVRLAEALKRPGLALLIADEGLALARAVAERIVLVQDGRIVLDLPTAEALDDVRLGLGYIARPLRNWH